MSDDGEFQKCEYCLAQPGAGPTCEACQHNKSVIRALNRENEALRAKLAACVEALEAAHSGLEEVMNQEVADCFDLLKLVCAAIAQAKEVK